MVAATKIVPLYIEDASIRQVEELAGSGQPVIEVKPYIIKKVGVVITGNEVYNGLIKDKFLEVIRAKVESMGGSIIAHRIVPDDEDIIADAVKEMSDKGSELIVTCGGLSVDPDDVTVEGIIRSGAHIISYGTPIMPSAMILLAMLGSTPILGAPAGGLFHTTGIDVLLPRLMAGEIISRQEVIEAGYGGLCLNCARCLYPVCPFAK
jgi:molybdenum cofactor synthesis domain-containing protein